MHEYYHTLRIRICSIMDVEIGVYRLCDACGYRSRHLRLGDDSDPITTRPNDLFRASFQHALASSEYFAHFHKISVQKLTVSSHSKRWL